MNVPSSKNPTLEEARAALAILNSFAARASAHDTSSIEVSAAVQSYPKLNRTYTNSFQPDPEYRLSLPDLQNGPSSLIVGTQTAIQHVGISNFRLPIRYRLRDGGILILETSVTGTVSLEAEKKGINMSRIMRSFYVHAEREFSLQVVEHALDDYKSDLESFDARIQIKISFPSKVKSLRSSLTGWQYYEIALELSDICGKRKKIMHLDYVYSSTCPCSLELSEHARITRSQLATPHSQRSVARISVEMIGAQLWFEDFIDLARKAVPTETQVMVKREDEQAFAELNAANPIFVEDAARSFCAVLQADKRVGDFRIIASHQESLHSHDAVSILIEGSTFSQVSFDPKLFSSLYHVG